MHKTERRNRNRRGKILIVTTIGNNRKIEICQVWQECILHLYLAGFVCDTNEIGLRDSHTHSDQANNFVDLAQRYFTRLISPRLRN